MTKPKGKPPVDRGPGPEAAETLVSVHDEPVEEADETTDDGED